MKLNKYAIALGIIILALVYRLLPNLPNFSPITSAFLFAGSTMNKKNRSLLLILGLVLLSDFILNNTILRGFYTQTTGIVWFSKYMIFTITSYILIFFVGKFLISKQNVFRIFGGSLLASIIFFLLTNAGAWIFDTLNFYPNGVEGLIMSLTAGIPFFQTSLLADLLFSGVLFGSYTLISSFIPETKTVKL